MIFRDIVGQRELIEKLIASVDAGRIPHAQLYLGPEGSGNLAVALAYAQYINCQNKVYVDDGHDLKGLSSDACGRCPSCLKFSRLTHPDLHFVYPNNANGENIKKDSQSLDYIEQWREILERNQGVINFNEWVEEMNIGSRQAIINIRDCNQILQTLSLKPSEARFRIVLIWMIEKLSPSIASALLKTLEEPEPQTIFLLVSENSDQILPTILSRTQIVKVPKIDYGSIYTYLTHIGIDSQKAQEISQRSNGNLIQAKRLVQEKESDLAFHESFADWMRICFKVDMPAIIAFSERLGSLGRESLKLFLEKCLDEINGCLLTRNCPQWLRASEQEKKFWANFSKYVTLQNIERYYNLFDSAIYNVSRNAYVPALITDISIEICRIISAAQKQK